MLGQYPDELFIEAKPKNAIKSFQAKYFRLLGLLNVNRLKEIGDAIEKRQDGWDNLHPNKIPNSTAI